MVWEINFNIGEEAMDVQHQTIFDYMNMIQTDLVTNHFIYGYFKERLDWLEVLCRMHFAKEEQLLDKLHYPAAEDHKNLHDLFLVSINWFRFDSKQCHIQKVKNTI